MKALLSLFRQRTPLELATSELIEAQRSKLASDTAGDYADAVSLYNQHRIERLRAYINELTEEVKKD
jgi:hypothetical protein